MSNGDDHRYSIFGLSVRSEIELPELIAVRDSLAPDVSIRRAPIETKPVAGYELTRSGGEVSLSVPGIATYRMVDGRSILVAPEMGASKRDVRLYLLGSAFAAILHQRELLPLHSNAVEIDGMAIAFLGHSGAGKSTLAAWFHDRGNGILSDDVCVVGVDERGGGVAYGGVPRVRLWRDALEASGRSADGEEQAADNWEKYNIRTDLSAVRHKAPLSHLYLFAGDGTEADTIVTRLTGSRAVRALVENTYRGSYVKLMGNAQRHFDQCVRLAQSIAIFEVKRPWGLDLLDQVGTVLETHARSFIVAQASLGSDQPLADQGIEK